MIKPMVLSLALMLSGCVTTKEPVVVYKVPELEKELFTSCPKPSKVSKDFNLEVVEDLEKLTESDLNTLVLKHYANTKNDHIACYKSLVNVYTTYNKLKTTIETQSSTE